MAGAAALISGRFEEDAPLHAEAAFIALWNQGLELAAIAPRLGIPKGTVSSRATALWKRGVALAKRPQGGADPSQRAKARPEGTPAPPATPVAPAPPAVTFVAVPEMQELRSLVKDLHARVGALEQTRVALALPAPPATPAAERRAIQPWTVRLSKALIEHLKAIAYERRIPPSQLLEELAWKALNASSPSTP